MTLSDFINSTTAINTNDGNWSVTMILKNGKDSTLIVDKCSSEHEAKERAYLHLKYLIEGDDDEGWEEDPDPTCPACGYNYGNHKKGCPENEDQDIRDCEN